VLVLILLVWLRPAYAQELDDVDRAKELFREGYQLAVQEKWAEALEKLEASRVLVERPSTVFNIGTALLRMRRPTEAIAAFERFLTLAQPDDPARAEAESLLAEARGTAATLEIVVVPAQAELRLDGQKIDPSPRLLDPGLHTLTASLSGYLEESVTVDLTPGERERVVLELAAVPPPAPIAAAPPPIAVAPLPEPEESIAESATFWVLLGVGIAVIGGAIAIGVAVGTHEAEPYPGTLGQVLEGLRVE
jgi:hypothetical protein